MSAASLLAAAPAEAAAHGAGPAESTSLLFVFVLATFIGLGRDHARLAAAAHAADVAHQRHLGDRRRRRDRDRRAGPPADHHLLGAIALFASMTNIVSGFLITDRMLQDVQASRSEGKPR